MIPAKPVDGNWLSWVDGNYPFDSTWERYLLTRTERPKPGSEEQLNDLRGISYREMAAQLAEKWFWGVENQDRILQEQRSDRAREREKERKRRIRLATLALDGKLGDTRDARDSAQATAQQFLGTLPPEQCDYDTLRDWEKMHHYALRVAAGENPERPVLVRDRKREAQQRREIADIDAGIGAVQAGRPRCDQRELWP